jgi:hypothetical protein
MPCRARRLSPSGAPPPFAADSGFSFCGRDRPATCRGHRALGRRSVSCCAAFTARTLIPISLLQQAALDHCLGSEVSSSVLQHVIVDEGQDTNHVQESLFFHLAAGHRNLCVVGDDDQALYRFRGSTVENLVEFPARCKERLGISPRTINLATNYRSRRAIVKFYGRFIKEVDWKKGRGKAGAYRVEDKKLEAARRDTGAAVVASTPAAPETVCREVARLVRRLIDERKVNDPNQVAFLYPSLKSAQVPRMIAALEREGLQAYAPRAGRFLEVEQAVDVFGVFLVLFGHGQAAGGEPYGGSMREFYEWIEQASTSPVTDAEVEERIREFFARNYDQMRQEGGHVLAEGTKEQALQQALHYWRKLKTIATTVTDTEVKLSLPGQVTPNGRRFVIEGVVDIVRDGACTPTSGPAFPAIRSPARRLSPRRCRRTCGMPSGAATARGSRRRWRPGGRSWTCRSTKATPGTRSTTSPGAWTRSRRGSSPRRWSIGCGRCAHPLTQARERACVRERGGPTPPLPAATAATATARFTCRSHRRYAVKRTTASNPKRETRPRVDEERELDIWIEENLAEER